MVETIIAHMSKSGLDFTCTTVIQSLIDCLPKLEGLSHYCFKLQAWIRGEKNPNQKKPTPKNLFLYFRKYSSASCPSALQSPSI